MHPEEHRLLQHALGQLEGPGARHLSEHLAACGECRARLESLAAEAFGTTVPGSVGEQATPTRPETPSSLAPAPVRGTSVGRYLLLNRLGAGGMGEVYAAYDPQLDRRVAIKLLRAGSLSEDEGKARLLREAQAMARLQHPNVIAVHDVGTFGERVFIAMEHVEGETLSEWLRGDRSWSEVVRVYLEAGAGLAAAHRAGLVHRDFKPENVLLGADGRPRVLDFGVAQKQRAPAAPAVPELSPGGHLQLGTDAELRAGLDSGADTPTTFDRPLTQAGAVVGTPGYMAPEQLSGQATDARSDQFSFCVALYEAVYGRRPFGGTTLLEHASEIESGIAAPPAGSEAPAWLFEVLRRGLANDPAQRWPSMGDLLAALRPKRSRAARLLLPAAGLGALLVGAGALLAFQQQRTRSLCGGAEQRLAGIWDAAAKTRIKQSFAATRLSFAPEVWRTVESTLDPWALAWVSAYRSACEAYRLRGSDSLALHELKQSCLDERLRRLEALSHVLATADRDTVANANMAARGLEPVATCSDPGALAARRPKPTDQRERAAEAELRKATLEARAFFDAGKYAHGIAILKAAIRSDSPAPAAAEASLWLGRLLVRAGETKAARSAYLRAAEQAIRAGDSKLQALAFSRLHGAEADPAPERESRGASTDWDRLARAAAAQLPDDWEVKAELTANDAWVNYATRRFEAALANYQELLLLQVQHLGPEHPEVAMTHNNLGVTFTALGRFTEAIDQYEKSFTLHLELEGAEHPNTASAQHNLATLLRRQGRYTEAAGHYERALDVRRAALGADHPESLKTSEALALVYISTRRHELALDLLQKCLASRAQLFGERSTELLTTYELLAALYQAGRFWKEALEWTQLWLEVAKEKLGPTSAQASTALLTQGGLLIHLGRWAEARKALDEAAAIRRARFGEEALEVAAVHNAQADLLFAQRRAAEALALYHRALELRRKSSSATAELKAADLRGIARCLMVLRRAEEAVAPLEEAVELQSSVEDKPELAAVQADLGRALWLAFPDRRLEAGEWLQRSLPDLSDPERADLEKWMRAQAVPLSSPDGGVVRGPAADSRH